MGDFRYGPDLGSSPSPGTRYFSSTHVMPFAVSRSQTSVPSRSIAKIEYPPPGNTTTPAPVFLPVGESTVIVGRETPST
jgi:hypothetical protein